MSRQKNLIGWIDFSSTEQKRVSQVLSMLQEKGTLDELGIGQIRDAFADQLFPGFSTIQTRAKYFVTIPYTFTTTPQFPHILSLSILMNIRRFCVFIDV